MSHRRVYVVWLAVLILLPVVGCSFSVAKWKSTSAESTESFSFLPLSLRSPGESAAVEMARLFQERDVLRKRIKLQAEERADVDAQIEVVEAQINIIPLFADQERRLTLAFNADSITTEQAADATDMVIEGNALINSMSEAQKFRDDALEKDERAALVALTDNLRIELNRLGV